MDRGRGAKAVDLFKSAGLPFHYACLGHGTANSDILDYLGLGETQKDVLLTAVPGGMNLFLRNCGSLLKIFPM